MRSSSLLTLAFSSSVLALAAACGGGDSFETANGAGGSGGSGTAGSTSSGAAGAAAAGTSGASSGTAGASSGTAGASAGAAGDGGAGASAGAAGTTNAGAAGTTNAGAAGSSAGAGGVAGSTGGGTGGAGKAGTGGTTAGNGGTAGAGGGNPGGDTVYVSTMGNDADDGLTPATPKRNIAAGISTAVAMGRPHVRVARGSFVVTASLEVPSGIDVSGGWSADFMDPWSGYTPNVLCEGTADPSLLTRVSGPGVSPIVRFPMGSNGTALGLDIVGEVTGVRFNGSTGTLTDSRVTITDSAASATNETVGVFVNGGAPTITKTCVKGGAGTVMSGSQVGSAGVRFIGGAKGALTQSRVEGGAGSGLSTGHGSAGVWIENGSPQVTGNDIRGGAGKSSSGSGIASLGLLVRSTAGTDGETNPRLQNNVVGGGSGVNTTGAGTGSAALAVACVDQPQPCQGIHLLGESAVSGNLLHGQSGRNAGGLSPPSGAVLAYGGGNFQSNFDLELVDNQITGGSSPTLSLDPGPIAVRLVAVKGTVSRNGILGGEGRYGNTIAVSLGSVSDVDVYSNMIHAGFIDNGNANETVAVHLDSARKVRIRHNTLTTGFGAPVGRGVRMAPDSNMFNATNQLRIDNNLFVGGDAGAHFGVELFNCPVGRVDSLQGNAFANLPGRALATEYAGTECLAGNVMGMIDFIPGLEAYCGAVACGGLATAHDGNVDVLPTCATMTPYCAVLGACNSASGCGGALFSAWSTADQGRQTLVSAMGWSLRPTLPCAVSSSPVFIGGTGPDRFGTARSSPSSRGAHEQDMCAP